MSDLVGNPEDRFSRVAAQLINLETSRGHGFTVTSLLNNTAFSVIKNDHFINYVNLF